MTLNKDLAKDQKQKNNYTPNDLEAFWMPFTAFFFLTSSSYSLWWLLAALLDITICFFWMFLSPLGVLTPLFILALNSSSSSSSFPLLLLSPFFLIGLWDWEESAVVFVDFVTSTLIWFSCRVSKPWSSTSRLTKRDYLDDNSFLSWLQVD